MKSLTLPTVGKDVQHWDILIQCVGVLIGTTGLENSLALSSQAEGAHNLMPWKFCSLETPFLSCTRRQHVHCSKK